MTQEEKELLMKDLCARLPYGVKGRYNNTVFSLRMIDPFDNYHPLYCVTESGSEYIGIEEFKPYLFPLSSMTEEQKEEFDRLYTYDALIIEPQWELIDWLNKNHFDYRGLIKKGLAIDATNKNIY